MSKPTKTKTGTTKRAAAIEILFEDSNIVAINKPAGLMVHPDGRSTGPFLTDWLVKKYPRIKKVGEIMLAPDGTEIVRPGIVHRLDRETSGVMLVAKTAKGHACLKEQFKSRTITKKYLAFVWGEFTDDFGTINRPIGRSGSDFRKWSAQRGTRGIPRKAETYWTRIKSFRSPVDDESGGTTIEEKFTLIEAEPKTGRTHQIRVHFLAIHHPVVGDKLYAENHQYALGFERTALHAKYIEFNDCNGKHIKIDAPLPKDFEKACKICGVELRY
jgi:23S rRNA pseudouridine1911/1915/1917 synthase